MDAFGQCSLINLSKMQIKSHPGCENIDMELIPINKTAMTIASSEIKFSGSINLWIMRRFLLQTMHNEVITDASGRIPNEYFIPIY